ncbi:hypothetical protein EMCRGX_G025105 [Ephydatia muelleri]
MKWKTQAHKSLDITIASELLRVTNDDTMTLNDVLKDTKIVAWHILNDLPPVTWVQLNYKKRMFFDELGEDAELAFQYVSNSAKAAAATVAATAAVGAKTLSQWNKISVEKQKEIMSETMLFCLHRRIEEWKEWSNFVEFNLHVPSFFFTMDNTSVNVGRKNSIMTKVQAVSPSVFVNGCACHIIHNTAIKAASAFETVTGFNVEDICIDIYYWFDKSTKRKQALKEFCEFCDLTYVEMVKHVSTRWLSLEKAVSRILQKYEGLKSYFLSNEERHARFIRLAHQFEDPMTEVYLLFYQSALQPFVRVNKFLQLDNPLISVEPNVLNDFIRKLCCRFLSINVVKQVSVEEIDPESDDARLTDTQLDIGFSTKATVNKLTHDGYALLFPFSHDPIKLEVLKDEFYSYQLLEDKDIPAEIIIDDGEHVQSTKLFSLDIIWDYLSNRKASDGHLQFQLLRNGKSCLIDTTLNRHHGVAKISTESGASKGAIIDQALRAITGIQLHFVKPAGSARRLLFFYSFLFKHSPIVVIRVPERQIELLTTNRETVIAVEPMSKEQIESIPELEGFINLLKSCNLDGPVWKVLGGSPAKYLKLTEAFELSNTASEEFVDQVKNHLQSVLGEALNKSVAKSSANTKAIVDVFRQKKAIKIPIMELIAMGLLVDYPNKVFREVKTSGRWFVEPATSAVSLIIAGNIQDDDDVYELLEKLFNETKEKVK